jgi:mannose/fructose/N-acetylgalactosamine-specific phosphotransferase system component IIC
MLAGSRAILYCSVFLFFEGVTAEGEEVIRLLVFVLVTALSFSGSLVAVGYCLVIVMMLKKVVVVDKGYFCTIKTSNTIDGRKAKLKL